MRHDVSIEGKAFRLRPIGDDDATFVVELRTHPELSRFLHPVSPDPEVQRAWLAAYYDREGDYYFVIEDARRHDAVGLVALYDISADRRTAEWGRWILRSGSPAAVESAWLIYRVAFEQLGLDEVYCRTVGGNAPIVSFHTSCGLTRQRRLSAHFTIVGEPVDAIEHRLNRGEWTQVGPRLERLADRMARRLARV